jgi:hypothetical protein
MIEQVVKIVGNPKIERAKGSAGYKTQVYGAAATVSNLANAIGGIKAENLVKPSM